MRMNPVPNPPADYVQIQLNSNTLGTRHVFVTVHQTDRFHPGFTQADVDAGWKVIRNTPAEGVSLEEIQAMEAEAIARHREYWERRGHQHGD